MKNTDLRAKARAIFGSAVAEPMPNQPNGAKALQQRANARPIPTYKVGGAVKKMPMPGDSVASGNRMSKMEADESRFMDMLDKKKKMPSARDAVDSGNRMSKMEGAEMRKMKMAKGGKAGRYADGGNVGENEIKVTGNRYIPQNVSYNMPPMGSNAGESMGSGMQAGGGSGSVPYAPVAPRPTVKRAPPLGIRSTAGYTGPTVDVGEGRASFGKGPGRSIGVGYGRQFKNGGKVQTASDTARKLATEMGGMRKGGKVKPVSVDMEGLESMTRSMRPAVKDDLETKVMQARNLAATQKREMEETAPKKQSFNQAFGAARERGDKTFSWNGGSYGTQLKGETPAARPAAAAPAPREAAPAPRAAAPEARKAAPAPREAAPAPRAAAPAPRAAAAPGRMGFQNAAPALSKAKSAIDRGLGGIDAFFEAANAGAGGAERARLANKAAAETKRAKAKKNYNPSSAASNLEMALGGYAKGGKAKAPPKSGLAVMIAIGKPMKPAKKMNGGPMAARSMDMESSKVTRQMAGGGDPMGYAAGGAGKTRKGQAPIKKAQGGAAKVRKGMMTPEGNITHAMNKIRG
jgi:hypothetical protein